MRRSTGQDNDSSPSFRELFSKYLDDLDNAPLSSESIFISDSDKERYETMLMYVYRKYKGAVYHYDMVQAYIEEEEADLERTLGNHLIEIRGEIEKILDLSPGAKARVDVDRVRFESQSSLSCDHYVHELSAFLEALKSSLDFLASVTSLHLKGVTADSISTLIKMAERGIRGPLFDEVNSHIEWLRYVREYRHHVVHRLAMRMSGGYEIRSASGKISATRLPVIILEKPPSYIADTRRASLGEAGIKGLESQETKATIRLDDGSEQVVCLSHKARPADGYVSVDDFMRQNLASCEEFLADFLEALSNLKFHSKAVSN